MGAIVVMATPTTITAMPTSTGTVMGSGGTIPSLPANAPANTAITGFTNAYVMTLLAERFCSAYVNAVRAMALPTTDMYTRAPTVTGVMGNRAHSPRAVPINSSTPPAMTISHAVITRPSAVVGWRLL